jgi:aspartyl-tRNA(Asn)/glutamyl-tRNA(Gln) amidotransferase subunit B
MPELPEARRQRFESEYGLTSYDAALLTDTRAVADYFEQAARISGDGKSTANWIMGDLSRLLNAAGQEVTECRITPDRLAAMITMIGDGVISGKIAKTLIERMFESGDPPDRIAEREGLVTLKDEGALAAIVDQVFAANPAIVADIRERGLTQKRGFLVGQVMKLSQGKADPKDVNRLIDDRLR